MKAERARLARLNRLERIRAIARRSALAEAGRAEATLAQLEALAARTDQLIGDYSRRQDLTDGGQLSELGKFVGGLQRIAVTNAQDVARARDLADQRAAEAALAERKRAAVEDRADATARKIARAQSAASTPLGARPPRED